MEELILEPVETNDVIESSSKPFVEANTIPITIEELSSEHIIPVFIKDNEPTISQFDFICCAQDIVREVYQGETILQPAIRVSHPVKGRVPEAKDKSASELLEYEKTIYYERMAFVVEVPTISEIIDGNLLSLTIGGVKAYNEDNLYNRKGADEHFKVFIGFQNKVCTNLCIWTDGALLDLKVKSIGQLKACIRMLIQNYNSSHHLFHLKEFSEYFITEQQFANVIGRCRMYNHLPKNEKREIPDLLFGDQQIGALVKDFYRDDSFCRMADGTINLWRLYNLFTNANKATYLNNIVERGVNAFDFIYKLKLALQRKEYSWYLS